LIKEKHDKRLIKESPRHWERKRRTRHGKDQMERTRHKGLGLERRLGMKRSKERNRFLHKRLKALGICKEHAKRIKNTRHLGRGSKAPSTHGKRMKRIERTRCMLRVHNKDR
jgi:hypothetical protein